MCLGDQLGHEHPSRLRDLLIGRGFSCHNGHRHFNVLLLLELFELVLPPLLKFFLFTLLLLLDLGRLISASLL